MDFEGKVVIVTGSASGIGRATAGLFARHGASVVVADVDGSAAEKAAGELGGRSIGCKVDVSKDSEVRTMVELVADSFGRIDVLVNNAGFGFRGNVVSIAEDDWDRLMSVNLKGVFLCSKHVIPVMAKQGGGAIVNTGSYTAGIGIADRAAYVASKGGVVSLTRAMALDHAADGIRVNCVAPGTIHSPYFDKMFAQAADPAAMKKELDDRAPVHRMGRPEEIAEAIVWLASDKASFAVGSTLTVDGGTSIW
ncbi:short-chain dehydrogenase [Bosea sp. Tri-44]|uniref:SDR family oxidoreductase n=1 Tax=Bosea sp. Tri-44 TaxID=1972137 RepID=UPI00100F51D9|nr:SDR family oxidoreductase [Bosea sp. Tri-44]RXT51231.1 short-chain dehydrogenase [Bosea sp. Tri-44]